ncbi:hydroxyacylglutathione hydrolase [Caldimonas brevitalea]|uniref:Hydroxyacylglutathione hydrolase n=1 Tax=Caldimonas brevitalea TaxID=413882 RepID=A0A0G3BNL7_9BURK|nr:hydroxyacylglutathione hydrolase [Caldimonas brevitalea]AKJ28946.1 hydroxyacylglutathione hydrolase [Caldimonas brevitalea]
MELVALPAFADNYIWMLHDGREALVVDPGQAAPVIEALQARGLQLTGILVTHHHADHVGGLQALRPLLHGPVFGPAGETIPGAIRALKQGDRAVWREVGFDVIDVPGHTAGHIAYWTDGLGNEPVLFCGDTLFSAGCGRLFEGTPAQMYDSLGRLAALPGGTRVCCAHEYTLSNLRFAAAVEPDNRDIAEHLAHCRRLRDAGQPTLPSTLGLELQINPFLRCDQPAVVAAARAYGATSDDGVAVLAALRLWKNEFR